MDEATGKFEIGDIVYKMFAPQSPGKIISIMDSGSHSINPLITVRLKINRREVKIKSWDLRSLEFLIKDHKKKISTHEENLRYCKENL